MIKEDGEKEAAIKSADIDGAVELTLRVAFGKMISKISSNSAGKGSANDRQKFVIRHLADSRISQLELFMNLATSGLKYLENTDNILAKSLPIGKQTGMLQSLAAIIKNINWSSEFVRASNLRKKLLDSILKFLSYSLFIISRKDLIRSSACKQFRDLRTLSIQTLDSFCTHAGYQFSCEEETEILELIGPQIIGLSNDSVDKPSPVLKLLAKWSELEDFRNILFLKVEENFVLYHITSILKPEIVSRDVSLMVVRIISKVITQDPETLPLEAEKLALKNIIPNLLGFFTATVKRKSSRGLDREILQLVAAISVDIVGVRILTCIFYLFVSFFVTFQVRKTFDPKFSARRVLLSSSANFDPAVEIKFFFSPSRTLIFTC